MPRQDVPYGGAICRLRERIAEIFDKLGEKLHTINGVPGDGDGNVKIVSGSSAVVISNDPTQNEIAVSLDTSQLPAAAVSSVNGQTGAVALTADDIPSDNGDVQTDLDNLAAADVTLQGNINAEALARQNADSTLQTNINAANAAISLKVDGSGNIGSDSKPVKVVNGNAVAVTSDLAYNASVVHNVNNETVAGIKTFTSKVEMKSASTPGGTSPGNYVSNRGNFRINGNDGFMIVGLGFEKSTSNSARAVLTIQGNIDSGTGNQTIGEIHFILNEINGSLIMQAAHVDKNGVRTFASPQTLMTWTP